MERLENLERTIKKSLQGKLSEPELKALVEWMEADPDHLRSFNEIKEKYESTEMSKLSRDEVSKMFRQFKARAEQVNLNKKPAVSLIYRIAAAILILIAGSLLTLKFGSIFRKDVAITADLEMPYIISSGKKYVLDTAESHISYADVLEHKVKNLKETNRKKLQAEWNELVVPRGCRISIDLADGTRVMLNSESVLKYPLSFDEESRKVKLTGEGFFEVSHDKQKPFIVETEYLDVTVLGTKFNLSAFENDDKVITTLLEGSVKLSSGLITEDVILRPNENGTLVKGQNNLSVKTVMAEEIASWVRGYYSFNSENLNIVMQKLERSYGIHIQLKDQSLKEMTFSGKLDIKDNITDVLDIISMVAPVEYEIIDNKIFILKTE